ncbi:glycoside hydrolase family 75 protein [Streptomyces sp. NPDC088725]|uniref:glycoside hydrolase family 75 protein n=1 Tax=Streptomyces sp. NPDC088725 TaxID=3365873 RepID=UPI0037FF226E
MHLTRVYSAALGSILLAASVLPTTALFASADPAGAPPARGGSPGAPGSEGGSGEESGRKKGSGGKAPAEILGAKRPDTAAGARGEDRTVRRGTGQAGGGQGGEPARKGPPALHQEGSVGAAALLARAESDGCRQVSREMYSTDEEDPATVPICGTKDAVFWKADLDVDCDGQATEHCNAGTDESFQNLTAFPQTDGKPLNAEKLPYIVVPDTSETWDYRSSGIKGGGLAAVIHGDNVEYAVVGDLGPTGIIGEASYATAEALGIPADPEGGGAASDVTYILFKDSRVSPIESHAEAVRLGDELARKFVGRK